MQRTYAAHYRSGLHDRPDVMTWFFFFAHKPATGDHIISGLERRLYRSALRELADRRVMLLHACADVPRHAEDYRNGNTGLREAVIAVWRRS